MFVVGSKGAAPLANGYREQMGKTSRYNFCKRQAKITRSDKDNKINNEWKMYFSKGR